MWSVATESSKLPLVGYARFLIVGCIQKCLIKISIEVYIVLCVRTITPNMLGFYLRPDLYLRYFYKTFMYQQNLKDQDHASIRDLLPTENTQYIHCMHAFVLSNRLSYYVDNLVLCVCVNGHVLCVYLTMCVWLHVCSLISSTTDYQSDAKELVQLLS